MGDSESRVREAFAEAESLAGEWMRTFSRFQPDSELNRLNGSAGVPVAVSGRLFGAVERAVSASRMTGGLFNPLILPALAAHGYDRSFEHLDAAGTMPAVATRPHRVDELVLDTRRRTVRLPAGSALDLGGIAKGLYADELAGRLSAWPGGVVSAGGDMRVWGEGPDDGVWVVGVEDPDTSRGDIAVVTLNHGGIATSGANRRRWRRGEAMAHHLIDPRSGSPARSIDRTVTVIAPTATLAEIGATACFIDPNCQDREALSRNLWSAIAFDGSRLVSFVEFDPEALINVYFNR